VRYVALLRGINVGGKTLIKMADLKDCVSALGYDGVSTYIASGNVLFGSPVRRAATLEEQLEGAVAEQFGMPVKVAVRSRAELGRVVGGIPAAWIGDAALRVNVAFLLRGADATQLARELTPREGVDEVVSLAGAVAWATRRDAISRSGLQRLVSQPAYKQLTVRNLNTTLKLHELLSAS
jgi:uncharacterized protein (DUF1697 family)